MVWENVPGAFSSNKGLDFAAVLEETIRIVEPEAPGIEVPEKGWPIWGCYRDMDGRRSVAWRTLDAQYWGVPQRRRRIALVADFGGGSAPEILFERKSVSWNPETCGKAREGTSAAAQGGADATGSSCLTPWDYQTKRVYDPNGVFPTLSSGENSGQNQQSVVIPVIATDFSAGQGARNSYGIAVLPFDTTQITSPQNGSKPKYGDPCHPLCAGAHPPAIAGIEMDVLCRAHR